MQNIVSLDSLVSEALVVQLMEKRSQVFGT